jgi:hypothetical protein
MDVAMTDTTTQALEALKKKDLIEMTHVEQILFLLQPLEDRTGIPKWILEKAATEIAALLEEVDGYRKTGPVIKKKFDDVVAERNALRARIEAAEQERDRLRLIINRAYAVHQSDTLCKCTQCKILRESPSIVDLEAAALAEGE